VSTTISGIGADAAQEAAIAAATTTTGTEGTGAAKKSAGVTGADGYGMDKDAFLRILVEQLRHQDPSQPGDSQQYVQQMTQFSMLEQMTNISEAVQVQHADAAADTAINLVGRTVTYLSPPIEPGGDPVEKSGLVESVDFGADGPVLTVGGQGGIVLGAVKEVR
jgi:flagellar basal-body rod modification protein FlgD